ncbi:hypothetical protein BOVMAS28_11120 [Streptococcus uberis]
MAKIDNLKETVRMFGFYYNKYFEANNENKIIYLKNLITTGRSVTFVIQNFKNDIGIKEFNDWYSVWQDRMKNNEVMKPFVTMRNNIEKQGRIDKSTVFHINSYNSNDLHKLEKPTNTVGYFMCDEIGGSGWTVDLGGGETDKIYIDLPSTIDTTLTFELKELDHLKDMTSDDAIKYYYWYILDVYHDFLRLYKIKSKG